jgi:hypothetical protein
MDVSTSIPNTPCFPILSSPFEWFTWISWIARRASAAWIYVDPSKNKVDLIRPSIPENPTKRQAFEFKQDMREYREIKAKMHQLSSRYIIATIAPKYMVFVQDLFHPYDMLKALQTNVMPSREAREAHYRHLWQQIPKRQKHQHIYLWLQSWRNLYLECSRLDMPEVHGARPHMYFLKSLPLSVGCVDAWRHQIRRDYSDGAKVIDFKDLVKWYCDEPQIWPHSASSASFQGQSVEDIGQRRQEKHRWCICGTDEHQLDSCPYVFEAARQSNWTPAPRIQAKVRRKLRTRSKLRSYVKNMKSSG